MIKAVLFDIDGVLVDSLDANYRFYKTLLTAAGYKFPRKEYSRYFHNTLYKNAEVFSDGSKEETEKVFKMGRDEISYPYDSIKMKPYAEEAVGELSKKYKLGIVTSRLKKRVYEIPGIGRLKRHFAVLVGFEDTKNHKPHPEPLYLACKKLRIKCKEAVYVGDAKTDIIAGKNAGMKTILYSRKCFGDPDLHTTSLANIPSLLK